MDCLRWRSSVGNIFMQNFCFCTKSSIKLKRIACSYSFIYLAGMDMAMLSLCDHNIITYGTFGVWGALLSPNFDQKWVILPQASEYEVLWTIKDIKAANFDNFEFL